MPKIRVVCCDTSPSRFSCFVGYDLDLASLEDRVLLTEPQELAANFEREMHNAAHHAEHGPVTYLQEVHEGGFSIFAGDPGNLQEEFFGPGEFVAFMDDEGPGHSSKVGPDGIKRTMRVLKGHLDVSA